VNNIGKGIANGVTMTLDGLSSSGLRFPTSKECLVPAYAAEQRQGHQSIDTIRAGDAKTLKFLFVSERTGKITASYLKFAGSAATGDLAFAISVGERGVPLSRDPLLLPGPPVPLPQSFVDAAMRVLGQ